MAFKLLFFEEFGKAFIFKKWRPKIKSYIQKTGHSEVPYTLFGGFFYISLLATLFIFLFNVWPLLMGASTLKVLFFTFFSWLSIQSGVLFVIGLVYYLYLEQMIFIRTQRMEDVLDEFLHLVSENIKGGLTLEDAFWNAVKPQFGVLSKEIRITAKKVMTGEEVTDALREFTQKYKSPMLTRAFNLIIQSIEGGGKISHIIDRVIKNIRDTKRLKKEMAATNLTYVIFVTFVVLVIAPALFTLSNQFLRVLMHFSGAMGGEMATANLPINIGEINVDPKLFKQFSLYAIGVVSVFASMIISIIRKGTIRGGIKLIPMYALGAYLSYMLFSSVAEALMGSFIGL